jgi:flagellar motility protein MotE (MotC chaperone)
MKEKKAGDIMASMEPAKAADLTGKITAAIKTRSR